MARGDGHAGASSSRPLAHGRSNRRASDSWAFGTGYILRSAAEFFLIGTVGSPKSAVHNVRNLIVAPVRAHSQKPDEMYSMLERMFPNARKCELFARTRRGGGQLGVMV